MEGQSYQARVNSRRPWLLVLLMDTSHSMGADWGGTRRSMIELVEDSVNNLLYSMALSHCVTGEEVRDRMHLAVLTYGGDDVVNWALEPSAGSGGFCRAGGDDGWVTGYRHTSTYESDGEQVEMPIWICLHASGSTPMLAAIKGVASIVEAHCVAYPDSFPPTVINISDGEPTDAGVPVDWNALVEASEDIRSYSTNQGSVLLCNVHLDPLGLGARLEYPDSPGPERHQRGLWEMSSVMPAEIISAIFASSDADTFGARRFYVYNADLPAFEKFLQFGTQTVLNTSLGQSQEAESTEVQVRVIGDIMPHPVTIDADWEIVEEE